MKPHRLALTLTAVALGAAACVSRAPIDESPCPCPTGYMCCENRCELASQSLCGSGPGTAGTTGGGGNGGAAGANGTPDGGGPVGGASAMDAGQIVVSPFVSVAIGAAHACAVRQNGDIECRGANDKGQATPPAGKKFYKVVAGANHTCGQEMYLADRTKDGTWICWGDNTYGQAAIPASVALTVGDVTAGDRHTCAILRGQTGMTCWGDNSMGQTSMPALEPSESPSFIAAGSNHTCATVYNAGAAAETSSLRVVCWGDNSRGQSTPPPTPNWVPLSLASGGNHSCMSVTQPDLFGAVCWGDNSAGQSTVPVGYIGVLSLASGHSCATIGIGKNGVMCWGTDWGTSKAMPPPMAIGQVYAGDFLNCATPDDPTQPMICWGSDYEPWY